jgi:hypothetical protein
MTEQVRPDEAARALDEINRRKAQVVDVATIPNWFWWATGALMVVLAIGVDSRRPLVLGLCVTVFVVGLLGTVGAVVVAAVRTRPRNELLGARGILTILGFDALVIGISLGASFWLRGAGVSHAATYGVLVGAVVLGIGGPMLMRRVRRIMLAGGPR